MAVPYAYLGFKATNKSKRKPEMELFSNSVFFVEREKYVMKDFHNPPQQHIPIKWKGHVYEILSIYI